jgi:predicted transcriptional regulator
MPTRTGKASAMEVTGEIMVAFLGRTSIEPSQLAPLIREVQAALLAGQDPVLPQAAPEPPAAANAPEALPMPVEDTIAHGHLICLEDGKPYRSLKRLLKGRYGMSPAQYRAKWGLPADYPMVAPELAERRSRMAKSMGLGGRPKPGERRAS